MHRILNTYKLHHDINAKREKEHLTWDKVFRHAGVIPPIVRGLSQGKSCQADAFLKLLMWLGTYDVSPYILTPASIDEEEEL